MSQDKEREAWKVGNEFAPYHPDASHVDPQYRDGWNACYRAAIASQQAVKGERIPSVLFDGYAVLNALSKQAQSRTSAENVSDVLDAVVRLLRASPPSREPLTAEALGIAMTNSYYDAASFIAGVRFAEHHHGIHSREGGSNG